MVSVVLPATTLVNDNSDDKPRHLPLYVNSLSSCLSYVPRGIASVTEWHRRFTRVINDCLRQRRNLPTSCCSMQRRQTRRWV